MNKAQIKQAAEDAQYTPGTDGTFAAYLEIAIDTDVALLTLLDQRSFDFALEKLKLAQLRYSRLRCVHILRHSKLPFTLVLANSWKADADDDDATCA
jgi:hypothetical protein